MTLCICAVDPGKATGVVWLVVEDDKPARVVKNYQIEGTPVNIGIIFEAHQDYCTTMRYQPLFIVEDWDHGTHRGDTKTDARWAVEPIGILAYLTGRWGVDLVRQMPDVRGSIPDKEKGKKKLEPLGYWLDDSVGHQQQALRHALSHVIHRMRHLPTMKVYNRNKKPKKKEKS